MASTSAVVYLRPLFSDVTAANRQTTAVLYIPFRDVSGVYVGYGLQSDDSAASAKSMLPGPRTALGYVNGDRTKPVYIDEATWYRLLDYILNVKLGGIAAPSMADVAATVTTVQEAVTSTVTTVTDLTDMALQNAAVLDTVREVSQASDLDGAEQIPSVIRQLKSAY
jgi:hypothetical protein